MKVLLINSNLFKSPFPTIPFGLGLIANSLEKSGYEIEFLDLCFSKKPNFEINKKIKDFSPEVIGVSIRNIDNGTAYNTLFLLDDIKKNVINPIKNCFSGPIIIGGSAVGINSKEILDFFNLEYAIKGDGEKPVIKFMEYLEGKIKIKEIPNLVFRKNGKIIIDNLIKNEEIENFPSSKLWKYIDLKKYIKYGACVPIQTKRGCALNCSYCTYNSIEGRKYRLKSPKKVADEIEEIIKNTGIKKIEFTDSCFNIPINHCKEVLREIIKRNLTADYRTMGLNPSAIDDELVFLMKKAGFIEVDCGIESGCNKTLEGLGKNFRKKDIEKAAKILHKYKIYVTWYLLLGGPNESEETLKETFNFLNSIISKWDFVIISVGLRVYNGAPISSQFKDKNNFLFPYAYKPKFISVNKIKELTKIFTIDKANYYMYDEDETHPLLLLSIAKIFPNIFLNKPLPPWVIYWIGIRKMQKLIGILKFKRILYEKSIKNNFYLAKAFL